MMRYLLLFVLGLICVPISSGAPTTKSKEELKSWGKIVDPDKDCEFKVEKGKLTITVPGKDKDLGVERGVMNAPRVLNEIEGDFSMQVRVGGAFDPSLESNTDQRVSFQGAGIVLMVDDKTYIRLERAALQYSNGEKRTYANWEIRENGEWKRPGKFSDGELDWKPCWFRVTRKGNSVQGAFSKDANEWQELDPLEIQLPKKIQIGVTAITTSKNKFHPEFDELHFKKLDE